MRSAPPACSSSTRTSSTPTRTPTCTTPRSMPSPNKEPERVRAHMLAHARTHALSTGAGRPLSEEAAAEAEESRAGRLAILGAKAEMEEELLLWRLQHHWCAAVDAGGGGVARLRAIDFLQRCSDRSLRASLREARRLLDKAVDYARPRDDGAADDPVAAVRGAVLFRLGQCQVLGGDFAGGRHSLEASLIALGGEARALAALGTGALRRRFVALALRAWLVRPELPPPAAPDVAGGGAGAGLSELGAAYECLAQLALREKQRWRAAYCAIRALDLGLQLPTLTPLVARAYTLLYHLASSHRFPARMQRHCKRKALQAATLLRSMGQEAELLDLYMG
eukprot:Transcript_8385.p1 GENE.Transcript_8385~~Transcript_8385.p1  ORF type:complete len:337 (+),score=149.79 Transcript_8385:378-1388(+)